MKNILLKQSFYFLGFLFIGSNAMAQRCSYTCGTGCPTIPTSVGSHTVVYCTPGTCTFTVPTDVTSISVEVYGAGGGGGGVWSQSNSTHNPSSDGCAGAGAGGGGGFTTKSFAVTAGQTYTVIVGAGGAGGTSVNLSNTGISTNIGTPGGTGGTSSFTGNAQNLQGFGGVGGNSAAAYRKNSGDNSQYAQAPGGAGGIGSGGSTSYSGGLGSFGFPNGSKDHGSAGGGCAGNNGNGNLSKVTYTGDPANIGAGPNTQNETRLAGKGGVCFSSTAGDGGGGKDNGGTNGAAVGNAGAHVGGGGAGALSHNHGSTAVSAIGGKGADGMVVIIYVVPLSVTLSDLSVACDNNRTINWSTASEQNSSHFIVERSRDGANWNEVNRVGGSGTTNTTHSYTVVDNNAFSGLVYYRLNQVDFDGHSKVYGPIVSECTTTNSFVAYPNPASNRFIVEINSDESFEGNIVIYDVSGKSVIKKKLAVAKGITTSYFDCSELATGAYILSIENDSNTTFKPIRLVVE